MLMSSCINLINDYSTLHYNRVFFWAATSLVKQCQSPIMLCIDIVWCSQVTNTAIRHISQSNQLLVTLLYGLLEDRIVLKFCCYSEATTTSPKMLHMNSTGVQKDWWILEAILINTQSTVGRTWI